MLRIIIKWLALFAIKILMVIALLALIMNAKANDFNMYDLSPNPKPYKPGRKSSLANKQLAPAYKLRQTPNFALKTNVLHDLTTSMNLGLEVKLHRKFTLDLPATLNPWTYNKLENTKFKFFLFQPALRYWNCEAFNGHFFSIHGHYAFFNVGHMPSPPFPETMNLHRFEGELLGAGISYGYHWLISPRWSFEAEIGAGFARLWYDKYPCHTCAKLITSEKKNYLGVTRAGLTFIYIL